MDHHLKWGSRIWTNIKLGWSICLKHSKWDIGNGSGVNFWYDNWLPIGQSVRSSFIGPLNERESKLTLQDFKEEDNLHPNYFAENIPRKLLNQI